MKKVLYFVDGKVQYVPETDVKEYGPSRTFKRDSILNNEIESHPHADKMMNFDMLSPWVLVDGYCAMRFIKGDNPLRYGSRVAFVEKTARVLIDNDDNWHPVHKSSDYGMSQTSLEECDKKLMELGYV